MHPATQGPGFGCGEPLAGARQRTKGKTNMSTKALAACTFEPVAEPTVATHRQAAAGLAADIQFREDLWQEYRREAVNAGFSNIQATEYASALSPELGRVAGVPRIAPVGRGWFYQSRLPVVKRTIASGLITFMRQERRRTVGRSAGVGTSIFAFSSRPWNARGKS
jgi:hypothetical protein